MFTKEQRKNNQTTELNLYELGKPKEKITIIKDDGKINKIIELVKKANKNPNIIKQSKTMTKKLQSNLDLSLSPQNAKSIYTFSHIGWNWKSIRYHTSKTQPEKSIEHEYLFYITHNNTILITIESEVKMIRNCLIINVMFIQNDTLWVYESN